MADVFSKKKRSWIMSRIRGKNTKPENALFAILKSLRYAVHRNDKSLPGTPDFVLPNKRIAVFVHGCFWHPHKNCKKASVPASNYAKWKKKLTENVKRDRRQVCRLRKLGWSVATFKTCKGLTTDRVQSRIKWILNNR